MPTGYTAFVENGSVTELKDFILTCARNFGAFAHMRDDALDANIRFRKVPEWYYNNLADAKAELQRLESLTTEDKITSAARDYKEKLDTYSNRCVVAAIKARRYNSMIDKVEQWEPPTDKHIHLKEFMLQQLKDSIKSDIYVREMPLPLSGEQWYQIALDSAKHSVEYYTKVTKEQEEITAEINEWITELCKSLDVSIDANDL